MHKSLGELLDWNDYLTRRQYLAWQAWLDGEWNSPNRSDHYLMSVAQQIERLLRQNANIKEPTKLKDFKLEFTKIEPTKPASAMTLEEQAQTMKAIWKARLGIKER